MEAVQVLRYLQPEEQQMMIRAADKCRDLVAKRDAAWLRALLASGCRVGEWSLITVPMAQRALATRRLVIPANIRKGKRRAHVVLVTEALRLALQDLLKVRAAMAAQTAPQDDALVLNRYGARLSIRSYEKRAAYWAQQAGVRHVTPHMLRHSKAMNVLRASTSANGLRIVQGLLGHESLASTGIYTRPSEQDLLAASERGDVVRIPRKRDALALMQVAA